MGVYESNLKKQIVHYYLFHKQIECFFNSGFNPFCLYKNPIIERFYVVDSNLVQYWKDYCNYEKYKKLFDKVKMNSDDIEGYKNYLEKVFDKKNRKPDIQFQCMNEGVGESVFCSKNILNLEDFDDLVDEENYQYFLTNLHNFKKSEIKGVLTTEKIILFYEKISVMKFLFYGDIGDPELGSSRQLIQLTGDFTQFINGRFDEFNVRETYSAFKKLLCSNMTYAFNLFESKNIRFLREETIHFSIGFNNDDDVYINYNFKIKNENLSSKSLEQSYKTINYEK